MLAMAKSYLNGHHWQTTIILKQFKFNNTFNFKFLETFENFETFELYISGPLRDDCFDVLNYVTLFLHDLLDLYVPTTVPVVSGTAQL